MTVTANAPRRRAQRRNPVLMLVTANPPSGAVARVKAAWRKFHHHEFNGRVRSMPPIPGGPSAVFALGECVALDFGTGDARPKGKRPIVVCDPTDDSLWLVAQGPGLNLALCHGKRLHAITYAPVAASGKEDADFRHEFENPLPTLRAVGNPGKCRAALVAGGDYTVRDWIYR